MCSLLQYLVPNWQNSLGKIRNNGLLEGDMSMGTGSEVSKSPSHFKFVFSTLCFCLEVEAFSYYFKVMPAWLWPAPKFPWTWCLASAIEK